MTNHQLRTAGFTLIELMITVAIIAILTLIAYPSYEEQMLKTRRSDAETALTTLANQETLFFAQNNYYTATIVGTGLSLNGSATSPKQYYNLSVTPAKTYAAAPAANSYTLSAIPAPGGPQAADGTFTLNSQNQKTFVLNGNTQVGWP